MTPCRLATRRARNLAKALIGYGLVLAGLMGMAACAALWLAKHGGA